MTSDEAIELVKRHGVLLESARGPVPNLAEMVAGSPIQGSWWGHPLANEMFVLTRAVRNCDDVLVCLRFGRANYGFVIVKPATIPSVLWANRRPKTPSVDLSMPALTSEALS